VANNVKNTLDHLVAVGAWGIETLDIDIAASLVLMADPDDSPMKL